MCKSMEEMRKEECIEVVVRMLGSGKLTYEEIASFAALTVDEVKVLDKKSA